VYDVEEFVGWFERQVGEQLGCGVDVSSIIVHANGASIVFKCGGKTYVAEIKNGRRFKASAYSLDYKNGSLVRIKKLVLKGPLKVYDGRLGVVGDNALFYVVDGVDIDVYEVQPPSGAVLEPRG